MTKDDFKIFISESEDLIQKTEEEILKLEENPNDTKPIQELYFTFHTLKGLMAMANFENVSKFCHHFESFLDNAKKNEELLNKTTDFISLMLESVDVLRMVIKKAKEGDMTDISTEILDEIQENFSNVESEEESFIKTLPIEKIKSLLQNKNNKTYKVHIRLQTTCIFKKVRLFIIIRALKKVGQICWSIPDPIKLENGFFEQEFYLFFMSTNQATTISQLLDEILEIDRKTIIEMDSESFLKELIEKYSKSQLGDHKEPISKTEKISKEEELIDGANLGKYSVADGFNEDTGKINTAKIEIEILERLMNYFGELVILKNQINQNLIEHKFKNIGNLLNKMDKPYLEIQEIIFNLKLIRVESSFRRYKRLVRDIAKETGKKLKFILEGTEVEIDRKILEELNAPIIHLIRNAIYHGIESSNERKKKDKDEIGTLTLRSYRKSGSVIIQVSDDGSGINYKNVKRKILEKQLVAEEEIEHLSENDLNNFLLMPGFSTLSEADIISGRGMGLAIVVQKIKTLGGTFRINSTENLGTTFTITVPFTRAIIKTQLIKVSNELFAIPNENITQLFLIDNKFLYEYENKKYYKKNSNLIPVLELSKYLGYKVNGQYGNSRSKIAVLCKRDEESIIFTADEVLQQIDAVVKPFKSNFTEMSDFLGSTIIGDGSICLILDVLSIMAVNLIDYNIIPKDEISMKSI